tara:strand:+ start:113 stop:424 length:312 start_codon:yes stop_codon:yes gene_type:complete
MNIVAISFLWFLGAISLDLLFFKQTRTSISYLLRIPDSIEYKYFGLARIVAVGMSGVLGYLAARENLFGTFSEAIAIFSLLLFSSLTFYPIIFMLLNSEKYDD